MQARLAVAQAGPFWARRVLLSTLLAALVLGPGSVGAEPHFPFAAGQVVDGAAVEQLRPWLPEPFYDYRRFFFYEGMELEIGPPQRDYGPPEIYRAATEAHRGRASIGADGALVGYGAGLPFPLEEVGCATDPEAGVKLIWNFVHRWEGFGVHANFRYTYWDRGEKRPLRYRGVSSAWFLKHRPESRFADQGGDVFPGEKRAQVVRFDLEEPPEVRGTRSLTYRYESSFGPLDEARPEDSWVFVRDLRRVRKVSETRRSSGVAGTDFAIDDLFSFSGLPAQYRWKCLGESEVLAPTNTRLLGYPYSEEEIFGPSGLSYGGDRWELRRAIRLEMVPKDPTHPYSRKEIWLDAETFSPLYSFAYDRAGVLWKIIYHTHRWSEDDLGSVSADGYYPGWDDVPRPRDLRVVSQVILNVQTGTGNRVDFWDSHGAPPPLESLRRYIDLRSLARVPVLP